MAERIQMETGVSGPDAPKEDSVEDAVDRPEWLPEKFESAEAMAKAYGELESRMGGSSSNDDDSEYEYEYEDSEEYEVAESSGISTEAMEEFSNEFYETGDLSQESLDRIESEFNIPQDIARAYVEGQKALVEQARQSIYNEVGGQKTYEEMLLWAKDSLSEADILAYDSAITSNDMDTARMVAKGLFAQYTAAEGTSPALSSGFAPSTGGAEGYQSWQQVSADMQNPKYREDPAFREEVKNRLAVSKLAQ
tara:strand:- start:883 stop:1635 length:753 start_codon:yes stop_codon:yes gene_type:complete